MKRLVYIAGAACLMLGVSGAAALEPAWGHNCLSCHSELQTGLLRVFGEDTLADPDETNTGAPDRGVLKVFQAYRGQSKELFAEVLGLSSQDTYAVELTRMRFPGVEDNGRLKYSGDCDWPEWDESPTHYTDPFISHTWPSGPTQFNFEISVDTDAGNDYYDLVFAVAGKFADTGGLFYSEEHFYLQVMGQPGDVNCDGLVDFADINPFVIALTDRPGYESRYAGCNWYNADCNGDGKVDFADINAFVALVTR